LGTAVFWWGMVVVVKYIWHKSCHCNYFKWHWSNPQYCVTTTTIYFPNLFITPNRKSIPRKQ
jgi:hypothetical protein